MDGLCYYRPYVDPEFESLIEHINPPRVCVDNDACDDCTLVKVDCASKQEILLEVVQILTDLDLFISKSYICSDGGWFMDVFHVTDQFGNKITDETLILYLKQAICTRRNSKEAQVSTKRLVKRRHVLSKEHIALEMTLTDQPGLLSEISAVLADLGCHVTDAVAWTHNHRAACIIYVDEMGTPITDQSRLSHIQEQLQTVVEAHHKNGEKRSVRLTSPATAQTHTERRLHQLMLADEDYKTCSSCGASINRQQINKHSHQHSRSCGCTHVSIESCKEKGYSVVNVRCKDRPKLLFDTICVIMDMQYMVFHAAISSNSSIAVQEYYVRHKDGCMMDTEIERQKVIQCLVAAVDRRDAKGLRLDITAKDRLGLLSDVTRVFRECGLSVSRADISTSGDKATGSFHVIDASGRNISQETMEALKREIDGTIQVYEKPSESYKTTSSATKSDHIDNNRQGLLSFGSLLWSRLERILWDP